MITACGSIPAVGGSSRRVLAHHGHPVQDLAGYDNGDPLEIRLTPTLPDGQPWSLRDYQVEAVDAFPRRRRGGGCGVVVLPCGAGKTLVGIAAMARLSMRTLILCTGHAALQQWKREILKRTTLGPDQVGEYTATTKELRRGHPDHLPAVDLAQVQGPHAPAHLGLFHEARWGAGGVRRGPPAARPDLPRDGAAAGPQAPRADRDPGPGGRPGDRCVRVGGPQTLRRALGSASSTRVGSPGARCIEVRVPLSEAPTGCATSGPASAADRGSPPPTAARGPPSRRCCSATPTPRSWCWAPTSTSCEWIAARFNLAIVTGDTPRAERERLFEAFRGGEERVLALSRVGNFAVDLPSASVAIQVSGTFGSRQEEAQRLGRILRPKPGAKQAVFYTLVTARHPGADLR